MSRPYLFFRYFNLRDKRVLRGPFRDMRYLEESFHSAWYPKMLGTYEREIYPWLESAIARAPDRVVVVGAAEGYYAVGLARRLPGAQVLAFESLEEAREALTRIAARNDVLPRLEVRQHCTAATLEAALVGCRSPLVVMDAEGNEEDLLDLGAVPSLRGATVLVELHEWLRPGIGETLRRRFSASHRIDQAAVEPRRRSEIRSLFLQALLLVRPTYWRFWLAEGRPNDQLWLKLEPR